MVSVPPSVDACMASDRAIPQRMVPARVRTYVSWCRIEQWEPESLGSGPTKLRANPRRPGYSLVLINTRIHSLTQQNSYNMPLMELQFRE
jgi:hypothetical protein